VKWLVRIGVALVALLVLVFVAAAVLVPRILDRPETKERIAAAAKDATGRTLRYERLGFGLLPPSLVVEGVALEGGPKDPPLRADGIALQVALAPLLARTVLVDEVVIRGADVTLARTRDGIELPFEPPADEAKEKGPGAAEPEAAEEGALSIAVREVRIEDSRVVLVDRTVRPAAEWVIDDLDASARGRLGTEAPITFEVAAKLAGAPLSAAGEGSPAGDFDAKLALDAFSLERLGPYLPEGLALSGPAALELEAKGTAEKFAGPLALDLTRAELRRGDSFVKPAGDRAAFTGRVVREAEAIRIEGGKLALRDVSLDVVAQLAPRTRVRLDAEPFELAPFGAWLPGLAESGVSGAVAFDGFEAAVDPLQVKGGLVLDGVAAPVGETRGTLTGRLDGRGDSLAGEAMELRVAEQLFRLGVVVDSLATEPQASLRLASEGADAGKLITGLSGKNSTLEGPLTLGTDLRAPLSDPDALLRALTGRFELGVTPGRLRGVSLLRAAFAALGTAGGLAERLGAAKGESMERFYQDAFETLAGTFQIGGGLARTEDLRLVYDDYRVDLAGAYGLLDESLDFRGKLTIFEEIDQALTEGGAARGVKREIPLAAVRGTLADPKVTITPQVALAFAASYYASGERRVELEKKIDEKLGEGRGKQAIDLLDSVLGGGKEPAEEEAP
jgi:AsmA protein